MSVFKHLMNEPFYPVYILYQKEVLNIDHISLQAMMDWLYMGMDSPYKFRLRNQAFLMLNNFGIGFKQVDQYTSLKGQTPWDLVMFRLKNLKEIYVDKRHKDTCVIVSKISASSFDNNVWEKSNPQNYTKFKPILDESQNLFNKKPYLITIIKFKEGHSHLLESIQTLDKILSSFTTDIQKINKQPQNPNHYHQVQNIYDEKNVPRRIRNSAQAYFNSHARFNQSFENNIKNNNIRSSSTYSAMSNTASPRLSNYRPSPTANNTSQLSSTLPRPLSTSSIRDLSGYTINSRHSLTPNTFSSIQNVVQQSQSSVQNNYGLFPVRSATRLNNPHLFQMDNSLNNVSEIKYSNNAGSLNKSQQMSSADTAVKQNLLTSNNITKPSFNSSFQNQSMTRITSLRNPRSLISMGGINPRSSSANETFVNDRRIGKAIQSEKTMDSQKARHDYFRTSENKMGTATSELNYKSKKKSSSHKLNNQETPADSTRIQQMAKDSLIDANLDIIKNELASLRIERNKKFNQTEQTTEPVQKSTVKTPLPTPAFLRNESTRLQEIIESFNNYGQKKSTINSSSIKAQLQPSPQLIINTPETSAEKPKTFTTTFNIFAYNKEFTEKPIPDNYPLYLAQEEIPNTPKVDGLISYFSSRSSPPTKKAEPSSSIRTRNSSPFKVNYHMESPAAPGLRNNTDKQNWENSTSIVEKSAESLNTVTVKTTTGRLDTEYYNRIFQGSTQDTNIRQNTELNTSTNQTIPSNSVTINERNELTNFKNERNADQLTMSVDSLETSSVDLKELTTETTDTIEPSKIVQNATEDVVYNTSDQLKTSYDLATYGLDSSVIQGEIEPIYKPIVLQRRSKNQSPGRKRTFANMIWPMSAEEERIMRSNSPFIVPEVEMDSNSFSLKSCLKKNVIVNTVIGLDNNTINSVVRENSGNKKVGFGEKFAFVSVFERFEPEVDMTN